MIDPITGRKRCSCWPYCNGTTAEPRMMRAMSYLCPRCYRLIARTDKRRRQALHRHADRLLNHPPAYRNFTAIHRAVVATRCDAVAMWCRFVNEARILRAMGAA